jgi:hypothetical protein
MNNDSLITSCVNLENALKILEHEDIDGNKIPEHNVDGEKLFLELIYFKYLLEKSMGPTDILIYLKKHLYLLFQTQVA